MPSPFPGMNPYLEQADVWHGFHQRFIPRLADALTPQVRPGYIVTLDSHVYLHELGPGDGRPNAGPSAASAKESARAAERAAAFGIARIVPGVVPSAFDVERDTLVTIRDRGSREMVTVIELLSPTSKRAGGHREQYLAKRREYLRGAAHLVEIDLLRGFPRLPAEGLPPCDYVVLVSRAERRPNVDLFPVGLRERLPVIPIPLRSPDPDAVLDLQTVLDAVYDAAGYEDYIYRSEPEPPLAEGDVGWAKELIPSGGR